jgi:hypothetical protein
MGGALVSEDLLGRLRNHPAMHGLDGLAELSGIGEAGFAVLWLAVVLVEAFVAVLLRGGVYAVEVLDVVLDWASAVH